MVGDETEDKDSSGQASERLDEANGNDAGNQVELGGHRVLDMSYRNRWHSRKWAEPVGLELQAQSVPGVKH